MRHASLCEAIAGLQNLEKANIQTGQILEYGPGACYAIDSNNLDIRYLSEKGRSYLPEEAYLQSEGGTSWLQIICEEDRMIYIDAIQKVVSKGQEIVVDYHVLTSSDGEPTPIRDYLAPLYVRENELVGFIGRVIDNTFRIRTMDTLVKRSWKEVSSIASRRFLHDFNNMIAGIYSLSELYAIPGSDAATMTEAMVHIRDSSIRAQKITQKIRALTTMNEGEESYFDIGKLIEEQRDYLLAILPKTVDLQFELSDESLPVRLDANRFRQALIHLASNASDAAVDKPSVRIRCRSVDPSDSNIGVPSAIIEFSDDGRGIDSQTLTLVRKPFYSTKDRSAHAGMGLFIVERFVKDLGGSLSIFSEEGEGTRILLELPLSNLNETIPVSNATYSTNSTSQVSEARRTPTILIYTWEDITRHPLINSIRSADWKFRIHLDGDQLQLDVMDFDKKLDGVLVFKSALDEKVDQLVLDLAKLDSQPKLAVVALGESVEAVSESIRSKCGLLVSGSLKPAGLMKTIGKYFY